MKKIVIVLLVLSFSCKKKDNQPSEEPSATTTGSTTGNPSPVQTTVTVSGYGAWLLRTSHSPTINPQKPVQELSFLEKDTTYVEILVNGSLNTAYLTVPTMTTNVYKTKMIYNKGVWKDDPLSVPSMMTPAVKLVAHVGDEIQVNTMYKPLKIYDATDEGKLATGGIIISGTQTVVTTGTVNAGVFTTKKWRETSANSELCSGLTIKTTAK